MIETIHVTGQAVLTCWNCADETFTAHIANTELSALQDDVEQLAAFNADWVGGKCLKCQQTRLEYEVEKADQRRKEERYEGS